jgi:hypothetical protein
MSNLEDLIALLFFRLKDMKFEDSSKKTAFYFLTIKEIKKKRRI